MALPAATCGRNIPDMGNGWNEIPFLFAGAQSS
jgi:hypothetical protein